jgi:hypothetical protein
VLNAKNSRALRMRTVAAGEFAESKKLGWSAVTSCAQGIALGNLGDVLIARGQLHEAEFEY